ncbi:MAG: hypothetical protein M1829_002753 [Trizodia sp. TS-e1964]|nr:MAG: hypothetical protein M1829_002753 [Trizodia sp. TS-e1964]
MADLLRHLIVVPWREPSSLKSATKLHCAPSLPPDMATSAWMPARSNCEIIDGEMSPRGNPYGFDSNQVSTDAITPTKPPAPTTTHLGHPTFEDLISNGKYSLPENQSLDDLIGPDLYLQSPQLIEQDTNSGQNVASLYQYASLHGPFSINFFFEEPRPQLFSVRLLAGKKEFRPEELFRKKKLAKDAAAALAMKYYRSLPTAPNNSKQALINRPTENWVGLLQGIVFTPQVTLPGFPGKVFGHRDQPFPNKKLAKTNAAQEAVGWLRSEGHMRSPEATVKRKRGSDEDETMLKAPGTRLPSTPSTPLPTPLVRQPPAQPAFATTPSETLTIIDMPSRVQKPDPVLERMTGVKSSGLVEDKNGHPESPLKSKSYTVRAIGM